MTSEELTLLIESLREYRLRLPLSPRRTLADQLLIKLMSQLTKGGDREC